MLMDATVATGAAAMMAIRVLLDHDVPEENITLCSLLMGDSGKILANAKRRLLPRCHSLSMGYAPIRFSSDGERCWGYLWD